MSIFSDTIHHVFDTPLKIQGFLSADDIALLKESLATAERITRRLERLDNQTPEPKPKAK